MPAAAFGLRDAGYYTIDALRIEAGRRAWGAELSPDETPFEAGLGFAVKVDKSTDFRRPRRAARASGRRARASASCMFTFDDPAAFPVGRRADRDGRRGRRRADQRRLQPQAGPRGRDGLRARRAADGRGDASARAIRSSSTASLRRGAPRHLAATALHDPRRSPGARARSTSGSRGPAYWHVSCIDARHGAVKPQMISLLPVPGRPRRVPASSSRCSSRAARRSSSRTSNAVVTYWNREATSLYGFSAQEAIGQPLRKLHAADLSDADYARIQERIRAGHRDVGDHRAAQEERRNRPRRAEDDAVAGRRTAS